MTNKATVARWLEDVEARALHPPGTEQQCGHPRCGEEAAQYFGPDLELGAATVTFSAQLRLEGEERFSCSDLPLSTARDQSVASHGTITRTKSWVWPSFSGLLTEWPHTSSCAGAALHSVAGAWRGGAVCGGAAVFRYTNDVTVRAAVCAVPGCGRRAGLAVASYCGAVVLVAEFAADSARGDAAAVARDWESGGLLWGRGLYLYPDMETALVGEFSGGTMSSSQLAEEVRVSVDARGRLEVSCAGGAGPEYSFSPSGPDTFGSSDPLLRDPYEARLVTVASSGMEAGGEGVFALTRLPAATLAAVFNGYRVPLGGGHDPAAGLTTEEERYARLAYNIHMPEDAHFYIDFPPDKADLGIYCASLGHKVNHSFLPNCKFGSMWHPRWGRVRTVVTTKDVEQGQELLVDYGYDLLRCPQWYRDLWAEEVGRHHPGLKYWDYRAAG